MADNSPYAVIESGSKQYIVRVGAIIDLELLPLAKSASFESRNVLFFTDGNQISVGKPHLSDVVVRGEVLTEARGPKVISYKYKKRKKYRRKVGHRQTYTRVRITELTVG